MTTAPRTGPTRSHLPLALAALALLLAAASCGTREGPTAPSGLARQGVVRSDASYTRAGDTGDLNEVAVLPRKGVNVYRLAVDYGATIARGSNYICVRFVPADGETPEHLAARLLDDSRVVMAERNAVVETAESRQESYASDDGLGSQHNTVEQPTTEALDLDGAHRVSQGLGTRVAVLDTGVDPRHPWLRPRIAGGTDFVDYDDDFTDRLDGLDSDHDGNIDEAYGHGTHVAGIVALAAPRAQLLIVRVLDANGRGDIASVTAGLRWAIDQRADVINLSLGMLHPSACIELMLEIADAAGTVVVASAGNAGSAVPVEYPASSEHAIAVAASDAFASPAPFTSYGPHVDVSAPGVGVRSSYPGNEWRLWSGTSMSAPFVSGTAALLKSAHSDWDRSRVMARIAATARALRNVGADQAGGLGVGMLETGDALAPDHPGRALGLLIR